VGWRSHYRRCPRGRLSRCHDSGSRKGKPGEHYIISAGDLTTREMFKILERETGIPVPAKLPNPLTRREFTRSDRTPSQMAATPAGSVIMFMIDASVDASKARQELNWHPCSVSENLHEIVAYSA